VLRYEKGGYFDVHHESTAFLRRYATLLYYLDGPGEGNGGGTVFPLGPEELGLAPREEEEERRRLRRRRRQSEVATSPRLATLGWW
jgi:hypothetical protein